MRISIVTLSFNQAAFLEAAIRSVIEQDHPDVEYIMVDPGSTDGSREIIARYQDRISVRLLGPDNGPGDGLNNGFAKATGEIFGYLNADDAYLPGALRDVAAAFADRSRPDVVSGHGLIVDAHGRVIRRMRSARFGLKRFAYGAAVQMQQSTFFRADAFARTPGFNNDNRTCWDAELVMELGRAGARFRLANRYWSLFRMHDQSITGTGRLSVQYAADQARLFQTIMGRPRRAGDDWISRAFQLSRWVGDPIGMTARLRDTFGGPPAAAHALAALAA